jgi:hypothetical protein
MPKDRNNSVALVATTSLTTIDLTALLTSYRRDVTMSKNKNVEEVSKVEGYLR